MIDFILLLFAVALLCAGFWLGKTYHTWDGVKRAAKAKLNEWWG